MSRAASSVLSDRCTTMLPPEQGLCHAHLWGEWPSARDGSHRRVCQAFPALRRRPRSCPALVYLTRHCHIGGTTMARTRADELMGLFTETVALYWRLSADAAAIHRRGA